MTSILVSIWYIDDVTSYGCTNYTYEFLDSNVCFFDVIMQVLLKTIHYVFKCDSYVI